MAADGLITIKSSFGPAETMNRFEAEVRAKGMTVFAHLCRPANYAERFSGRRVVVAVPSSDTRTSSLFDSA